MRAFKDIQCFARSLIEGLQQICVSDRPNFLNEASFPNCPKFAGTFSAILRTTNFGR